MVTLEAGKFIKDRKTQELSTFGQTPQNLKEKQLTIIIVGFKFESFEKKFLQTKEFSQIFDWNSIWQPVMQVPPSES